MKEVGPAAASLACFGHRLSALRDAASEVRDCSMAV